MKHFWPVAFSLLIMASTSLSALAQPRCDAPMGWWEDPGLPALFASANSPTPTTDCNFHIWSWTAFVHWMQNDMTTGQPMFLSLPTPAELKSNTAFKLAPRKLILQPRTLKPDGLGGEIQQAGSKGVLVDQAGRVVYYAVHMDSGYFTFAQQYYGPVNYKKAPDTAVFPLGSTVLKTSWQVLDPKDTPPTDAYSMPAEIAELTNGSKGLQPTGKMIPATAVLVGVHVVGVIKDHPEFAWATFEQLKNAPDLPHGMSPKSSSSVSSQNYRFYKAKTAAIDCNTMAQESLTAPPQQTAAPITNVFRQFAFGNALPDNVFVIQTVNKNFQSAITEGRPNVSKVFANYGLIGTSWQKAGSLVPSNKNMDSTTIGSPALANSTMETYVQGTNCFSCHNTGAGKNIDLSHILLGASK